MAGMFDRFAGIFGFNKAPVVTQEVNTVFIRQATAGVSGTTVYGGTIREEYLDSMLGNERAEKFAEVREDYCATMLLTAVKAPILAASREIRAASEDVNHTNHKKLIEKVLLQDIDLDDLIYEQLTMCDFGYALFEESHRAVLEPVLNDEGGLILPGYITLNQPEWRNPKTILYWNFDPISKKLKTVSQQAQGDLGNTVDMDADFLNILTLKKEGQNLEGRSLLRPCYGCWYRKNNYLKLNAIGIEKSLPLPTAEIPMGKDNSVEKENLILALEAFTSHEKNYLTYPVGWKIDLSTSTGYDPAKTEVSIDAEDKRMSMAFLANFLLLGSNSSSGSYALSNDLSDFFLSGELYLAKIIEKAINKYIVKLIILNFGRQDKYPTFKLCGIDDKAGIEFANMIKAFVDSRVIVPDTELEESIRKRTGLPKISEEGQRPLLQNPLAPNSSPVSLSERVFRALAKRDFKE